MKFQANIAYKTVVERKKYTVTSRLRPTQYNADSLSMAQTLLLVSLSISYHKQM